MYTKFHIEATDAKGRIHHFFTQVGGGTMTPEQLVEHFKRHHRFTKAQNVKIIPIEGDEFPASVLAAYNDPPKLDLVKDPDYQVGDTMNFENFANYMEGARKERVASLEGKPRGAV